MNVSGAAAWMSAQTLANNREQASLLVLRKALDLQQAGALRLVQSIPEPARPATDGIGTRVDTWA